MADSVRIEEVCEAMFTMVADAAGQKKYKPGDLIKSMIEKYGEDRCDKQFCKQAIRELVESQRLIYTYFGGSYLEVPHKEGAAPEEG
ncbi:MAG TPA: hypothetical protein PLG59_00855 [bacterium]|nr:hypothetical protein [bacterium]HQO33179.1 hypothetical protein [bacterium]HQP97364.1 hypothetical protein [bacterium]